MQTVTMVLADGPGFASGDLDDRIELHVVLTPNGQLDAAAWETGGDAWHTARLRHGVVVRSGELVKTLEAWALRELGSGDDPLYRLQAAILRPGELVSVSRLDGGEMIYRIVAVDPG